VRRTLHLPGREFPTKALRALTQSVGVSAAMRARKSHSSQRRSRLKMLWGERRGDGTLAAGDNRWRAPCPSRMT
jgi:hypothetical protein